MSNKKKVEEALVVLGPLTADTLVPVKKLEEAFELKSDDPLFPWLVSELRRTLYEFGLYLSGEGVSKTKVYSILPSSENRWVGELAIARAERDLEGKRTLLLNTNVQGFSSLQLSRHEGTLRKVGLKLEAMRSAEDFESMKKKRAPRTKEIEISEA